MKAVLYLKNEKDKFQIREVPRPSTKPNEILIKVQAASLNAADYRSLSFKAIPKSKIFGSAVSGIVAEVGSAVTEFAKGDEVMADISDHGFGGLSEYTTAPASAVSMIPSNCSHIESATLPLAATTAYFASVRRSEIQKGHKVLILGSGGGVGTYIVQLAHHFEGIITAVCGPHNIKCSLETGAHEVVDYTKNDILQTDQKFDLIFAVNGNYPLRRCMRLLKNNGEYIAVGGSLKQIFSAYLFGWMYSNGNKKVITASAKANAADLSAVKQLTEEKSVFPMSHTLYQMDQVNQAMSQLMTGHVTGKVVIKMD